MITVEELALGVQTVVNALVSTALLTGAVILGFVLIGRSNQNMPGKAKQKAEHLVRRCSRKMAESAQKNGDDDALDFAAERYGNSMLRSFRRDFNRGADVVSAALSKPEKKQRKKLL